MLFADSTEDPEPTIRFDAFAVADDAHGDADGDITLAELGQVPLVEIQRNERDAQADGALRADGGAGAWTTLEDFVYLGLFPRVVRFGARGACTMRARPKTEPPR